MAGRAKSKCKKQHTAIVDKEKGLAYAIKVWNNDKKKPEEDQRSLQAICCEAEEEMNKRKKKHITIDRCNLLESTIKDNNIVEDCIWAADKTGFQPGNGRKQRVIGPAQMKMQHQQRDGNRKNITMMVTICADGGSIAPTIIYKGKSFLTNWHQDNTLKASWQLADRNIITEEMMAPSLETSSQVSKQYRRYSMHPISINSHARTVTNSPYESTLQPGQQQQSIHQLGLRQHLNTAASTTLAHSQLAAQEEKQKRRKKGQLNSDGLPRLLTGDEFYNRVVEHQTALDAAKAAQEDCCKQKEEQSGVLTEWKKLEKLRKTWNTACREAYHEAMHLWKEESNLAKQERRRVGWGKAKARKAGSEDEQSDENIDGMESDGESAEE
ncbi:hypothetical protein SERLADRAFT_404796 [Serpula lacrymans var. lacrymans S7.9]|uniref:DDE-1 domain-containing protein n=1 Tax=Serpula lacrymans var. lacrymans (strain S7.9) TaxID=578457 RepID=F8NF19_SERL9|nr:uncharacterized protein SERLADRAFT_404796 [Serpula lacrymans var. lacrymans S7.9]EGO30778.1 hypothetical protein SERLADRAFT_404796 [Serpula lacrymans var. lacrymans S7.9]